MVGIAEPFFESYRGPALNKNVNSPAAPSDETLPVPEHLSEYQLEVWHALVERFKNLGLMSLEYSPCIDILAVAYANFRCDIEFISDAKDDESLSSFTALSACFNEFGCTPYAPEGTLPVKSDSILAALKDIDD